MSQNDPGRRTRSTVLVVLIVVGLAALGGMNYRSLAESVTSVTTSTTLAMPIQTRSPGKVPVLPSNVLGESDGAVPTGTTVFDDDVPAVAKLDPELRTALRRAANHAAENSVVFNVNSGWRSPAYQNQLLRDAVTEYGSEREAARWVATAENSVHVSGDAVDVGPNNAAKWLSKHGAEYGLCQIYKNEPWHYELRQSAIGSRCPSMYADPTQDPRMQ